MDIWHRVGRIARVQNLGTLIFFVMNMGMVLLMFCPDGITGENAIYVSLMYILTVIISMSPVGGMILAALAGAQEIKRKDIKIRLIPLLEIVYSRAKEKTPSMVD